MGDRMTAAEANEMALTVGLNTPGGQTWSRAAAALWHWENEAIGREREDAARRGMPELVLPWRVLNGSGEAVVVADRGPREAFELAASMNAQYRREGPFRAVRLAVVEVVAEPEPVTPRREVGPSGYEYVVAADGVVEQWHGPSNVRTLTVTAAVYRYDYEGRIPPADRALVARLLGEGVGDA